MRLARSAAFALIVCGSSGLPCARADQPSAAIYPAGATAEPAGAQPAPAHCLPSRIAGNLADRLLALHAPAAAAQNENAARRSERTGRELLQTSFTEAPPAAATNASTLTIASRVEAPASPQRAAHVTNSQPAQPAALQPPPGRGANPLAEPRSFGSFNPLRGSR